MALKQLHALVSGMVQGVGYRYFVQRRANQLRLYGIVRNLPDGRVEVIAEGNEVSLNELYRNLMSGPSFSRVDDVLIEWREAQGKYKSFQITY